MVSAWEWNRAILRKRWPVLFKRLNAATTDGCMALNGTPEQALIYRDRQVVSAFDQLDEAKRQAEGLDRDAEAVYCYGIGLGHLPAVLAARHKLVCVVIMNLSIARAAFESAEHRWLTASHVGLCLAEDVDILYAPYACVPMECRQADQQGYAMRDRLFAHLNKRYVDEFHFKKNVPSDLEHISANKAHVEADRHVSDLFGTKSGGHVVIVGGGPSLGGEIDWLKSAQAEGATVVTASTVLRLLLSNDIVPDVTVALDTERILVRHLDDVPMERLVSTALLYHATIQPEFVAAWTGPRYHFAGYSEMYMSGTVMHCAADLAVKMGAARVTMLGCDFCYPANRTHADGTFQAADVAPRASLIETVDGNGDKAHTDWNLAQYHRHLEDYIAHNDNVRWFKRGRSGVPVRGAEWL